MKKIFSAVIAVMLAAASSAYAAGDVYLNGVRSASSLSGNMLAVRAFFEDAGYTVQWFPAERRVTAYDGDNRKISLFADESYVFLGQQGIPLDCMTEIVNGRLIMPLAAAQLALNAVIEYKDNDIYITSSAIHNTEGWEYKVLELTNTQRKAFGLPGLVWNASLAEAAASHAQDMAERGYFSHDTPEGKTPFEMLSALGLRYTHAAENIAAGQPDPESVVDAWMNSEGHRENILDPDLREMGAAYARGGKYGIYWAQEFATTQ